MHASRKQLYFSAVAITVTEGKMRPLNHVKLTGGLDDGRERQMKAQQAKHQPVLKAETMEVLRGHARHKIVWNPMMVESRGSEDSKTGWEMMKEQEQPKHRRGIGKED